MSPEPWKMQAALEAVLLFYTASHWGDEEKNKWNALLNGVLGEQCKRQPEGNEATTRNLCNVVREALREHP